MGVLTTPFPCIGSSAGSERCVASVALAVFLPVHHPSSIIHRITTTDDRYHIGEEGE
jgi:hypothetical protein